MAGHPTVGSTFALAHTGVLEPGPAARGVRPEHRADAGGSRMGGRPAALRVDDAGPAGVRPRASTARSQVAAALGLTHDDLAPDLPIQEVSCGVPFLFVPLRDPRDGGPRHQRRGGVPAR